MNRAADVLIIGAGIVGAAIARECARAGMRVAIVEAGAPGGAVTAAGMGHVVVMDDSPAQLALTRYSRELWQSESAGLPDWVEYNRCGTIWVAADDEEMTAVQAKQQALACAGVESDILDTADLAHEEPNLRRGLMGGLLVAGDAVLYPPAAARYLLDEAVSLGTEVIRGGVIAVERGTVSLKDGTRLYAERVVLASGAHSELLPDLPIQPRKGHLVITDRYPGIVRHQLVELGYLKSAHTFGADSVAFNVQPRGNGQLLIGSSRQFGSTSSQSEPAMVKRMLDRACGYMPLLGSLSALRVWTGFRAATPDKLPLLGPAAEYTDDSSLWLAMGFEGLGITQALGAARLLKDALLEQESAIDRAPFLARRSRFPVTEMAYA